MNRLGQLVAEGFLISGLSACATQPIQTDPMGIIQNTGELTTSPLFTKDGIKYLQHTFSDEIIVSIGDIKYAVSKIPLHHNRVDPIRGQHNGKDSFNASDFGACTFHALHKQIPRDNKLTGEHYTMTYNLGDQEITKHINTGQLERVAHECMEILK